MKCLSCNAAELTLPEAGHAWICPKCKRAFGVEAVKEIERLRLERDLFALNLGRSKDCPVMVVMGDDGNVSGAAWPTEETGSSTLVIWPKWHEAAKEQTDE